MFGMGGSEILVILIVALLFLGPDKLPDAAKQISKGIRDIKKQTRMLQQQIEDDEHIGGAIRDLKSALRGDELPVRPPVKNQLKPAAPDASAEPGPNAPDKPAEPITEAAAETPAEPALAEPAKPTITLSPLAGEIDPDRPDQVAAEDLASLIKPAPGTVAKGDKPEHG